MAVGKDKWNVVLKGGTSIIDVRPVFSFDSKFLMCVSGKVIKVVSLTSGEYLNELRGHKQCVTCIELSPVNKFQLLSASIDRTLIRWDYQDGVALRTYNLKYCLFALYRTLRPDCSMVGIVRKAIDPNSTKRLTYHLAVIKLPRTLKDGVGVEKVVRSIGSRAVEMSVNTQDGYVACIQPESLLVYVLSTKKYVLRPLPNPHDFPDMMICVACHPTEQCIATGCDTGKILLWWNFLSGAKHTTRTVLHWHTWHVADLCFTPKGACLLSGGKESVLIKWSYDSSDRQTLPRLTAPFQFITCSPDGTRYATCHKDNVILIIESNLEVTQVYQGLTHCRNKFVRLTCDPRSATLVCPGRPGHLQFYCVETNRELYSLDIVGQNYFTPAKGDALVFTVIDCMAFSETGDWLATVETRNDEETAMEMRLKFWRYDRFNARYSLNTMVDLPHTQKVTSIAFRPSVSGSHQSAVTTSLDGQFKLWQLEDDTDIYRSNEAWTCECVGYYRHQAALCAEFSADGSMLAIGFGPTITLWDPDTNELRQTMSPLGGDTSGLIAVAFGVDRLQHLLSAATKTCLTVYDLLTSNVLWAFPLDINLVASNRFDNSIAVFSIHRQVFVFRLDKERPIVRGFTQNAVKGAVFVPYRQENADSSNEPLSWQRNARLCFMTMKQELWIAQNEAEIENSEELPTSHPAIKGSSEPSASLTPFAMMLSRQRTDHQEMPDTTATGSAGQFDRSNADSHFISEMLATPAHVLPPMGTLCSGFLDKLMTGRKSRMNGVEKGEEESEDEDREDGEEEESSSSEAEMDVDQVGEMEKVTENVTENVTGKVTGKVTGSQNIELDDMSHAEFTWTNNIFNM